MAQLRYRVLEPGKKDSDSFLYKVMICIWDHNHILFSFSRSPENNRYTFLIKATLLENVDCKSWLKADKVDIGEAVLRASDDGFGIIWDTERRRGPINLTDVVICSNHKSCKIRCNHIDLHNPEQSRTKDLCTGGYHCYMIHKNVYCGRPRDFE